MLMSLLGLGTGMMLANFHTCGIVLSLSAALYMFVRYFNPSVRYSVNEPFVECTCDVFWVHVCVVFECYGVVVLLCWSFVC